MNSVKRVSGIFRALRESPAGLPLHQIADRVKIPRSTAHRFLQALVAEGLVCQNATTRHYRIGPEALQLGLAYLEQMEIREMAAPVLRQLTERTGRASFLTVLDGEEAVCVETVEATFNTIGFFVRVGRPMPFHAASAAQALLIDHSPVQIERLLKSKKLQRFTPKTRVTPQEVVAAVQEAAVRGYATCYEELETGVNAIAAPVYDSLGRIAASVAIVGLAATWTDEEPRLVAELLTAAGDLSTRLGYRPHREATRHG